MFYSKNDYQSTYPTVSLYPLLYNLNVLHNIIMFYNENDYQSTNQTVWLYPLLRNLGVSHNIIMIMVSPWN